MAKKSKALLIGLVNLAGLIVALVMGEVYLFIIDQPQIHTWGWRYQGWNKDERNQLSFRGRAIDYDDTDFVVVLIGDSQVQADLCDFDRMPERRLEDFLSEALARPVRVLTLGAAGYGQDQQLLALTDYFKRYSADLIVHWETVGNDVWNNMFPTHWPKDGVPKPTFWLDENEELRGPVTNYSRFRLITLIWHHLLGRSLDDFWEREYLPPAYQPLSTYQGQASRDWGTLNISLAMENIENEKTHVQLQLVPASRRTDYGLKLTNGLIRKMNRLATENGAQFVAFAVGRPDIPLPDGVYALERSSKTMYVQLSKEQWWHNLRKMNAGIEFFLVPILVKPFMESHDPHLNQEAVDQVMKSVALTLANREK